MILQPSVSAGGVRESPLEPDANVFMYEHISKKIDAGVPCYLGGCLLWPLKAYAFVHMFIPITTAAAVTTTNVDSIWHYTFRRRQDNSLTHLAASSCS